MNVQAALKGQYRAALATHRAAIERCPDELWAGGDHPLPFWQVAYHTLFFTHFYLSASMEAFRPWPGQRGHLEDLASRPAGTVPYTKDEILEYQQFCEELVGPQIDSLDLDAPECGFPWYPLPKLEHQLVNIRHIQHHAAQLGERVKAVTGQAIDWVGWR